MKLDLGCGENKQEGFTGMDVRNLPEVDIVHDLEVFPWPVHDEDCMMVVASHILEHIKPWLAIDVINEIWRVLKVDGTLAAVMPYPGTRVWHQDPTHCCTWNEASFQYFDPRYPLYNVYKPKPWTVSPGFPVYQSNGMIEVIMTKMDESIAESMETPRTLQINVAEDVKTEEALR